MTTTTELTRYDDAIEAIRRLDHGGYTRRGAWTLGQICRHLAYYYRGSLDGFGFMLPWILRATLGRSLRKKIESGGGLPKGARTVPQSVPPPLDEAAERAAIAEALELLGRLSSAPEGSLHPSPLFGPLSSADWERLHLRHTAHHLGFLQPRPAS